jgi:hypothetical protein
LQDRLAVYPRLTLARAVYGTVFVWMVAVGLLTAVVLYSTVSDLRDSALDIAVRVRANAAGENLARELHNDWIDLKFLSVDIPNRTSQRITGLMEGVRGNGERISWAGYADVNGKILAASNDLLVGEDLSASPWFRNGLKGAYAGDVHDAVLPSKALGSDSLTSLRLVDLAMPVINAAGQTMGVVSTQINFSWAQNFLEEQAATLGMTFFLVGADGKVVIASNGMKPTLEEVEILRLAQSGAKAATLEVWPDGNSYFSSLVPQVVYDDLPNFGWRLIGRLEREKLNLKFGMLGESGVFALLGSLALLGAMCIGFVRIFVRPIEELGEAAEAIADGKNIYPPDINRTRETAQLSASLARLQSSKNN